MPADEGPRLTSLDNGVRVLTEEVPGMRSVALGVWVESGSRHEEPSEAGISHFLEHLIFKGTDRRSAREIAQEIEGVGGILNAFTGKEATCFYAKVLREHLDLTIDLLSDVFLHSTFPPSEIEREREVIVQEILQYEDTPDELVHDLFAKAFWPGHALGRPIAGTVESVRGLEREELQAFRANHYASDRVLIAAAGGVTHDEVLDGMGEGFGALPRRPKAAALLPPAPAGGLTVVEKDLEQAQVCLGVPALAQDDPDRYAAQLLNQALGGGMSSRLFQRIREERGRAYAVYSFLSAYRDCGYLGVAVGTSPGWVSEVIDLVRTELDDVRHNGIDAAELARSKNQIRSNLLLGLEGSDSRMSRLARSMLTFGRVLTVDELLAGIDAVEHTEVSRVAERILSSDVRCLTVLGNVDAAALERA